MKVYQLLFQIFAAKDTRSIGPKKTYKNKTFSEKSIPIFADLLVIRNLQEI